jgi:hypothetical protein
MTRSLLVALKTEPKIRLSQGQILRPSFMTNPPFGQRTSAPNQNDQPRPFLTATKMRSLDHE